MSLLENNIIIVLNDKIQQKPYETIHITKIRKMFLYIMVQIFHVHWVGIKSQAFDKYRKKYKKSKKFK